eukprot:CAMPEP_0177593552 /NCGR_PEP_ID=MMETSP0419_2-20121207/9223_1 /TAXON_ID=582737 /ORGANISM="Tetraselmis sp., Strain GSL018" /LENGTH=43 /DNA_ID= /DNA_START= /DNA_END= /DNA_ORIENTATION=
MRLKGGRTDRPMDRARQPAKAGAKAAEPHRPEQTPSTRLLGLR